MSRVPPRTHDSPPTSHAARLYRMRTARGACWVIVAGAVGAAGLVLLDSARPLPGWVRGVGLAAWLTGVGVLAWRFVLRPPKEPGEPDPTPRAELPGNLRAATAATLSLLACLLVATFLPGAADHLRRVAFPWQGGAPAQYRVVVTSGDAVVRRGGAVTLSAYAEKLDPAAPGAAKAIFAIRTRSPSRTLQFVMPANAGGEFHLTRSGVGADFEYRVEVGGAASDWFTVTTIDAVELADGSTTELFPPRYAPVAASRVTPGFASLDGHPHATAEYRFRFTRPAAAASLEFLPPNGPLELTAVALSEDGMAGAASFRLKQDGTLRLVLIAEDRGKRLRAETIVSVRVKPDRAPRFTLVRGVSPRPATVRPQATIGIEVAAADDIAVGSAALEYTLDSFDSRSISVPIPLAGAGTPEVRGRLDLPLPASLREGQRVSFRLRVSDTRQLDEPGLTAQHTYYPREGWLTLRVDSAAAPLEEQEITGRRDAVREALQGALDATREAREAVEKVLEDDKGEATLATENVVRLTIARDAANKAAGFLRDAAQEANLNPELRPLGTAALAVAGRLAKDADAALRLTETAKPADRAGALGSAVRLLANCGEQAEGLVSRNDRLARDRLDAQALAILAADLSALSKKVATLPPADALAAHRDILARFEKLVADSDAIRTATDGARYQEFQRLAALATNLASAIHELNAAAKQLRDDSRGKLLEWVAGEQKTLADRAVALLARVETAARLANVTLPKADAFRQVPELLSRGKTLDALTEMAALAQALGPVANTFETWGRDRQDAKLAAGHLALWQDDLRDRFKTATGGVGAKFDDLPARVKVQFRTEQAAIVAALGAIKLPPGEAARTARDTTLEHLRNAESYLNGTGANADKSLEIAVIELKRLAKELPPVAKRLGDTRGEFEKLWREQESIRTAVEAAQRNTPDAAALAKKLTQLVERQKAQLAAFEALDLPGMEARRTRVLAALAAAAADLAAGLPHDSFASQQWAKRELDWVRTILVENTPPPDERADEIARRVAAAANAVETRGLAMTDPERRLHAQTLQDAARQVTQFPPCPEASILLNDARDAINAADFAFRTEATIEELARRLKLAAGTAAALAERLNGRESDLDRVRRLAAARRAGAAATVKTPNAALAAEVSRQLGREIEELTHTRVGAAGQSQKKQVLVPYTKLRDDATPERWAGLHTQVATALEELAALMADIAELNATFDRAPPANGYAADAFLPSQRLADEIRDLARAYRASRDTITDLPAELVARLRPTDAKALLALEKQQRELAGDVGALMAKLSARGRLWPAHPDEAAAQAARAADRLRDGAMSAAKSAAEHTAAMLRQLSADAEAKEAGALADRQDAILKELTKLLATPGVAAARQRRRAEELARELAALVQTLESVARDAGDDATAKALTEAADTAKVAAKLLADAGRSAEAMRFDEAAASRTEAEATLRAAAGVVAGAGPVTTTLPNLDAHAAALGESMRRADAALRQATRLLDGKPDVPAAAKAMQTAAEELDRAAKATAARLVVGER